MQLYSWGPSAVKLNSNSSTALPLLLCSSVQLNVCGSSAKQRQPHSSAAVAE
jgi:hypothetical protein